MNYVRLMRPQEWIKNVIVLAGPVFGQTLLDPRVACVLVCFCLVASASYAINDVLDREADRVHPEKRTRPVAAGSIPPWAAVVFGAALLGASVLLSSRFLPAVVTWLVLSYFVLILAYSLDLKQRAILDVIVISVGFILRAVAGTKAVEVYLSPWLMVCTFMLCLFLGFGKRRCELTTLAGTGGTAAHRKSLIQYTPDLLNHLTSVSAGIAIVTFIIYTMDHNPNIKPTPFVKEHFIYTVPLVAYGLFRYTMLVESGRFTGPTQIILKDVGLILTGLAWIASALVIVFATKAT